MCDRFIPRSKDYVSYEQWQVKTFIIYLAVKSWNFQVK